MQAFEGTSKESGKQKHATYSRDNDPEGVAWKRIDGNGSEVNDRRISFNKHAKLSRMLRSNDYSSEDDELFTLPSVREDSPVIDAWAGTPFATATGAQQSAEESIPMNELSQILSPSVFSEVKAHFKRLNPKSPETLPSTPESSLTNIWRLKSRKRSEKILQYKAQVSKTDCKVRKILNNLPEEETVNTFYLSLVKQRMLREVEALFSYDKLPGKLPNFEKNYRDADDKSALTIAIKNKDEQMMTRLIELGVDLGLSIFHAIEADFLEGLKLLLLWDPCTDLKIEGVNHYFQIGMTPMILAAHNNNYRMLSLLHDYGHRLTEIQKRSEGIHLAWESSNERRMICYARAQPAYITLLCEVNHMNPMKYCIKEIKMMNEYEIHEREFSEFYIKNRARLEDYMCSLLDLVCSSDELARVFQFNSLPPLETGTKESTKYGNIANMQRWRLGIRFELLEKARRINLVRFVTHQQSQLALSYLYHRTLPFLKNNFILNSIGLFFPILSIFYICAPDSTLGSIITLPVVSLYSHMVSDVIFAVILFLKIALRDYKSDRLGEPLSPLEWLICFWILGKWLQEVQECLNRGSKAYFRDYWNYSDLVLLLLFTLGLLIRISDVVENGHAHVHTPRYMWDSFEPRLIGEGFLAFGYVFVFIRILGITRVNRQLGPLTISLTKMLDDIIRFLCIFALVLFAFAFGLSDLYWYYGTSEATKLFCEKNSTSLGSNTTNGCTGEKTAFSSIPDSLYQLFWALFGIFELKTLSLGGKHNFTEVVGTILLATYHVVAITVMLNMLIAMMSNSFNTTSEDEETAWKFHRTSVWIRYIRREVTRPPPMNLIPNPWKIKETFLRFKNFLQRSAGKSLLLKRRSKLDEYLEMGSRDRNSTPEKNNKINLTVEEAPQRIASPLQQQATKPKKNNQLKVIVEETQRRRSSSLQQQAIVEQIRKRLRGRLQSNELKDILGILVRRYKLKYLVAKKQ